MRYKRAIDKLKENFSDAGLSNSY